MSGQIPELREYKGLYFCPRLAAKMNLCSSKIDCSLAIAIAQGQTEGFRGVIRLDAPVDLSLFPGVHKLKSLQTLATFDSLSLEDIISISNIAGVIMISKSKKIETDGFWSKEYK